MSNIILNFVLDIAGFLFYLFEVYIFFHEPTTVLYTEGDFFIYFFKIIILFLALPSLYIFRIFSFFGLEDAFSYFITSILKSNNANNEFQIKLFYRTTYLLLLVLMLFRLFHF